MLHTLSELPGLNFSKSQREHPRHELTLRIMAWQLPMREISRSFGCRCRKKQRS